MKQTMSSIVIAVIAAFSLLLLSHCTKSGDVKEKKKDLLKLGVLLPLTGPLSPRGEEERRAIQLAVNDFNTQSKDAVINAIFEDSYGASLDAVTKKFLEKDNVSAIVASTTSVSRSIFHLANKNKIIMAFLCADSTIQRSSPYIFRLYESKEAEANQILEYYIKKDRDRKVVVLYANHPEITGQVTDYLIPKFMYNIINVVFYAPYDRQKKDFSDIIERVKSSGATSLLILGFGDEYRFILEELDRQKILGTMEIVGGFSLLVSQYLPQELLEGVIVAAPEYILQRNEKAKAFQEKFSELYGHAPGIHAAFAYNATQILLEGLVEGLVIGKGSADTVSFRVTNRKYYGILGDVSVDNEGGLTVPMGLGVIKKGMIQPLLLPGP